MQTHPQPQYNFINTSTFAAPLQLGASMNQPQYITNQNQQKNHYQMIKIIPQTSQNVAPFKIINNDPAINNPLLLHNLSQEFERPVNTFVPTQTLQILPTHYSTNICQNAFNGPSQNNVIMIRSSHQDSYPAKIINSQHDYASQNTCQNNFYQYPQNSLLPSMNNFQIQIKNQVPSLLVQNMTLPSVQCGAFMERSSSNHLPGGTRFETQPQQQQILQQYSQRLQQNIAEPQEIDHQKNKKGEFQKLPVPWSLKERDLMAGLTRQYDEQEIHGVSKYRGRGGQNV
eukprot:403338357